MYCGQQDSGHSRGHNVSQELGFLTIWHRTSSAADALRLLASFQLAPTDVSVH
jgi:hypothetical protein